MQKRKYFLIAFVIFTMIAMYGIIPRPDRAVALDGWVNVRDTISDSDISATGVTHTFTFTTQVALPTNGFWSFTFPSEFTSVVGGPFNCGYGTLTASTSGNIVDCRNDGAPLAATTTEVVIEGVTNPDTSNSYVIQMYTYNAATTSIEHSSFAVYILDDVVVTATVDANLTFTVSGTSSAVTINGDATNIDTSATSTQINFGTITPDPGGDGGEFRAGQDLFVTTNAADGFTVTVEQDNNLDTPAGADIDSLLPVETAIAWTAPSSTIGVETSYGHFGVASDDTDIGIPPADGEYVGLNGSNPLAVMTHNGVANGTGKNSGWTSIMYNVEISNLQEAGDYENSLTYICTPQY